MLPKTIDYVINFFFFFSILLSFQVFKFLRLDRRNYLHFLFKLFLTKELLSRNFFPTNKEDFIKSCNKSYLQDGWITKDTDGCLVQQILSPTYEMDGSPWTSTGAWSKKSKVLTTGQIDHQGHRRVPGPKNPKSYLREGRITDGCLLQQVLSPTYGWTDHQGHQ